MALIYRSIFRVEDPEGTFVDRADAETRTWLARKLGGREIDLPDGGVVKIADRGVEVSCARGIDAECRVRRLAVFEGARDDGVEVKTTITAIRADDESWGWIDLERWMDDSSGASWVPIAPGVLTSILRTERASRGATLLSRDVEFVEGEQGAEVARALLARDRDVPFVVVSYERLEGPDTAKERGREICRRVSGVANVVVLGEGAVSEFSRTMLDEAGPSLDVHSGAVRIYLPGLGQARDFAARHRFVPYRNLERRGLGMAAAIVAPIVLHRAIEIAPPLIWRKKARALLLGSSDGDYDELLDEADKELSALRARIEAMSEQLAGETESVVALGRQVDELGRQNSYLRRQVSEAGGIESFDAVESLRIPQLCGEVVEAARSELEFIEIHADVDEAAWELDEHADESWAPKSWRAFQALNEYARAKAKGAFTGDFKTCCEQSAVDGVIPAHWIARTETKQTMTNTRFRELRTLPVSTAVDPAGVMVMVQHVKISQGGTPSPRIHFHDDTTGKTGKIHVGWFGDHLDSRGKS